MAVTREATKTTTYRGLLLNTSTKGSLGFYSQHLQTIYSLMLTARTRMNRPLVSHLVIDAPALNALNEISRELKRWYKKRYGSGKADTESDIKKVSYFACLETRPRNQREHLHVMVIFDSLPNNSTSLAILSERLSKLSKTKDCKIQYRKSEARPLNVDQETGEIRTNTNGGLSRLGSTQYHNLITELLDAFERFSYLAKVQTKDSKQVKGLNYSHSRIINSKPAITQKEIGNNESHPCIINLPKHEALLSVRDSYKESTNQMRSKRVLTIHSCQIPRVDIRAGKCSKLFQSRKDYHRLKKGSEDSKNYDISIRV